MLGILIEPPHLEIAPLHYLATRKQESILGENMLKYTYFSKKKKKLPLTVFSVLWKAFIIALKRLLRLELGPFGKVYKSFHLGEATGFPGQWVNQTSSNHRILGSEMKPALSTLIFEGEKTGISEVNSLVQATHITVRLVLEWHLLTSSSMIPRILWSSALPPMSGTKWAHNKCVSIHWMAWEP